MKSNITVLRKGLIFILTLVLVMQSAVCCTCAGRLSRLEPYFHFKAMRF